MWANGIPATPPSTITPPYDFVWLSWRETDLTEKPFAALAKGKKLGPRVRKGRCRAISREHLDPPEIASGPAPDGPLEKPLKGLRPGASPAGHPGRNFALRLLKPKVRIARHPHKVIGSLKFARLEKLSVIFPRKYGSSDYESAPTLLSLDQSP
jgi:hypothetical protein